MNKFFILIIRLLVGGVFAVVITRMFKPEAGLQYVVIFALALVGAAYGLEYLKNKNKPT